MTISANPDKASIRNEGNTMMFQPALQMILKDDNDTQKHIIGIIGKHERRKSPSNRTKKIQNKQ